MFEVRQVAPVPDWADRVVQVVRKPSEDRPSIDPPPIFDTPEELEELGARARATWGGIDEGLIDRVVREATLTRVFFERPLPQPGARRADEWDPSELSPIGQVVRSDLGSAIATLKTAQILAQERAPVEPFEVADLGPPVDGFLLRYEDVPIGAAVVSRFAFAAPVPPEAAELEVSFDGSHPYFVTECGWIVDALRQAVPDGGTIDWTLNWRMYEGANTVVTDGVALMKRAGGAVFRGSARIRRRLKEGSAILVGRLAATLSAKAPDSTIGAKWLWRVQLSAWEHLRDRETAELCRDIGAVDSVEHPEAVIAIHGTNGCAVPMASRLREILPDVPVYRYEHETLSVGIAANASPLTDWIHQRRIQKCLLVAHSRGGLVARQAVEDLDKTVDVRVVTLGTPFEGTHWADAVREGARIGGQALQVLAIGGAAIPLLGQLALLLFGSPEGVVVMGTKSDYINLLRTIALGDRVLPCAGDATAQREVWKVQAGNELFRGEPHDGIVAVQSASKGSNSAVVVECGHSDYLDIPEVRDAILREAAQLELRVLPSTSEQAASLSTEKGEVLRW